MRKKLNNKPRKADILRLRAKGKTYNEISKELGCSKSVISYHCGNGNEKKRLSKYNKERPVLTKKISSFKCTAPRRKLSKKLKTFRRRDNVKNEKVNNISKNYSVKDVVNKLTLNPVCHLTGKRIDVDDGSSYQLDHIIPCSKGGTNDLDNLDICTTDANQAKGALSLDELYKLCEDILAWRDRDK